jgi:chromosome segregation protein
MRLEKLEIQGFKSFRDKTILEFPDKFTAIVGPNGSGKSNIVDSICFVLGKSRGLRASNLKELIYNGGLEGNEARFARVTLHLKNNEREVTISREATPDGQSVYKIDNKRASRQEIVDLVGDNEYNIILQNDVTKVIEMQPTERRQVIDDLCGIGEYDKKKAKAIKELETVENRIAGTHIALGEKKSYLDQLGTERVNALKYKDLNAELDRCSATIIHKNIESHEKKLEAFTTRLLELEEGKVRYTEELAKIREDIEAKSAELKELNSQILELEKEKGLVKIPEITGELTRQNDRLENLRRTAENNKKSSQEKKEKRNKLIAGINGLESKLTATKERLDFLNAKIKEESEKIKASGLEKEIDAVKTAVFELKSKITAAAESEEQGKKRIEDVLRQREALEQRIRDIHGQDKDLEKQMKDRTKLHKDEFDEFGQLRSELPKIEEKLERLQEILEDLRVEHAAKKTEIETVERSSGGLKGAISAINKLKEIVDGVHGPIFQLGRVLNPDYEEAMKVAAGGRMYDIVVENEDVAIKCINYLREKKVGRATFLPLSKIRFKRMDKPPKGGIGFAREFITTNERFRPAFEYVFGNTVLVRNLDTAKTIGVGTFRMVTLEGDLLTESGAMTGGYAKKVEIGFSRTDELEKEISALDQRIIELDGERQELLLKKRRIDEKLSKLETPVSSGKTDVEKIRLEKESLIEKVADYKYRIEEVDHIIKGIKQSIADEKDKVKDIEKDIKTREKELEALQKKRTDADAEKVEKLKDGYRDLEIEQKTVEEKRELMRQQITELDDELKKLAEEKTATESETAEANIVCQGLEKELRAMEKENVELVKKIEDLLKKRTQTEEAMTDAGASRSDSERSLEKINEELNDISVKKAAVDTRLLDLRDQYAPYVAVDLLDKGIKELEGRAEEIRGLLAAIGSVNLRSIETYEIVKKEYDETNEKLDTLKSERQSIFDFMEKVEQKKRETFSAAFEYVKKNFEHIYKELTNGEGTLILDNPREISASGLIIKASPKGKKLINIDAMSGGEKALTSSAFLLAIQQYKPSYFYIVDEIDAALDKTNSLKLAELLRNSAAQFLLISHNDEVIKNAESVIGVSMSQGISQIVGVKLT